MRSICSRGSETAFLAESTSTIGLAPETVIVSSSDPTFISALTVAVKLAGSSSPSRLYVLKPGSVNVTVYTPGRRSTMLYTPRSSLTTARIFSISSELAASTVTPGRTAPLVSFTTPVIALAVWDHAVAVHEARHVNAKPMSPSRYLLISALQERTQRNEAQQRCALFSRRDPK